MSALGAEQSLLPPAQRAHAEVMEDLRSADQLRLAYGLLEPRRMPVPRRERETGKEKPESPKHHRRLNRPGDLPVTPGQRCAADK